MRKSELQSRWQPFSQSTATLPDMLRLTQNLTHSPFGLTEDGLLDFRGMPLVGEAMPHGGNFSAPVALPELRDADFSHANWLGFDLRGTALRNVRFERTRFEGDTRFCEANFSHCVFTACSWSNAHFVRSVIEHTQFSGLKPSSDLHFNVDRIDGCLFEGKLRGMRFGASPISNTRFVGSLHDCSFYGHPDVVVLDAERELYGELPASQVRNRMAGVDWSQACLTTCSFGLYSYLDLVVPPPMAVNLVLHVTQSFHDAAQAELQTAFAEHPMADQAQRWLQLFYKPDLCRPFNVASPQDRLFKDEAAQRLFYEALVRAALATGTRVG